MRASHPVPGDHGPRHGATVTQAGIPSPQRGLSPELILNVADDLAVRVELLLPLCAQLGGQEIVLA